MKPSRLSLLVVGAAALAVAVAGCKGQSPDQGPRPLASVSAAASPAADELPPGEVLAAAQAKSKAENQKFVFNMSGDRSSMTGKGASDVANHRASASMEINAAGQKLTTETIQIGDELWLRYVGLSTLPKQWMHVKISQLKATSLIRKSLEDPSSMSELLRSAFAVKKSGERGFEGTVDMTKSPTATPQMVAALGDEAKAVPFRVTLDDQGRISVMTIDLSRIGKTAGVTTMKAEFFGYGEPVQVQAPAPADVVEMPANLIAAL
ncbi:hypothetical protein QEZ54_15735 [Catellatospora sp. KI3]|uniref:hypothetical protein n=1 Tax=Catellatospora sp. KI3 TaxID=3041620 RepID=UPI0024826063|nr:hypothetical protein [Catellatospora sp. KI3]MDI1462422.1 hypothetical protein [Catellatospora sp. KI3]